jgi:hypothetical protein
MASTSLQFLLADFQNELAEDGFLVPSISGGAQKLYAAASYLRCPGGVVEPCAFMTCPLPCTDPEVEQGWRDLRSALDTARKAGQHVFLSAEDFDRPDVRVEELFDALHGFNVTTLVMYRHYFDWMASVHGHLRKHEMYALRCATDGWCDGDTEWQERRTNTLSDAARRFTPLVEWLHDEMKHYREIFTSAVLRRFAAFGAVDTIVIDPRGAGTPEGTLEESVFCRGWTPNTCSAARANAKRGLVGRFKRKITYGVSEESRINEAAHAETLALELAVVASNEKLLPQGADALQAATLLADFVEEHGTDVPMHCLGDEEGEPSVARRVHQTKKHLQNITLEKVVSVQSFFKNLSGGKRVAGLNKTDALTAYNKALSTTLCSVDARAIFAGHVREAIDHVRAALSCGSHSCAEWRPSGGLPKGPSAAIPARNPIAPTSKHGPTGSPSPSPTGAPSPSPTGAHREQKPRKPEDGMCPKPNDWCIHAGATNEPKECGGVKGHFCYDTEGQSGFSPCNDKKFHHRATWGNVECLPAHCACSSICTRDAELRSASGHCGQALSEGATCTHERLFAVSQPDVGFVVLERNEVYRVDDMVYCDTKSEGCFRGRLDARTIMCERMYRGTLLRKMFAEITSSGSIACDEGCEMKVAAIAEPVPGFSYGSHKDAEHVRSKLEEEGGFLAMGGYERRIEALSRAVEAARDKCTPAADNELVVPLRMGDVLPSTPEAVIQSVKDALASASMQSVRLVVFNAVMHYGSNQLDNTFMRSTESDQANLQFIDMLSTLAKEGIAVPVTFRSEPSVDTDLCYLVHSPHVMIAESKRQGHVGGSFPLLVGELRSRTEGARRHTLSVESPWPMVRTDAMKSLPRTSPPTSG